MSFATSFMHPIGPLSFLFSVNQWEASKMFQATSDATHTFQCNQPLSFITLCLSHMSLFLINIISHVSLHLSMRSKNYGSSLTSIRLTKLNILWEECSKLLLSTRCIRFYCFLFSQFLICWENAWYWSEQQDHFDNHYEIEGNFQENLSELKK